MTSTRELRKGASTSSDDMRNSYKRKRGDTMERELILRALTDPAFRKELEEGTTDVDEHTRTSVLAAVQGITTQVARAPDELLCAYGPGPCGIC